MADLVKRNRVDRLELFAPPRLASLFRTMYAATPSLNVGYHHGSLGGLSPTELAHEPSIAELLGEDAEGSSSRRAS